MTDRTTFTGVVLAGGRSQRMGGGDKCLLTLGPSTMLERIVARFAPQVGRLVLSANGDPARFARLALPVLADPLGDFAGPLAGLLAAIEWTLREAPATTHVASAPGDAPFLPLDLVARLAAAVSDDPRAVALARSPAGLAPVCGLWPVGLDRDLRAALSAGTRKVRDWAGRHPLRFVDFASLPIGGQLVDPFFNVNSPADLDEARRLVGAGSP